jgi:hypothetical protein
MEANYQARLELDLLGPRLNGFRRKGSIARSRFNSLDRDCCRGRAQLCRACTREVLFHHAGKNRGPS